MAAWSICCFQERKSHADPLTWPKIVSYFFKNKVNKNQKWPQVSVQVTVIRVYAYVKCVGSSLVFVDSKWRVLGMTIVTYDYENVS